MTKNDFITTEILSGSDLKAAEKAWKDSEHFKKGKRGGVFQDYLDWLSETPRSEREMYLYILEFGTANEARWVSQRNSIRLLTISVFENLGESFTEEAASDIEKADLKAMFS